MVQHGAEEIEARVKGIALDLKDEPENIVRARSGRLRGTNTDKQRKMSGLAKEGCEISTQARGGRRISQRTSSVLGEDDEQGLGVEGCVVPRRGRIRKGIIRAGELKKEKRRPRGWLKKAVAGCSRL